MGPIFVTLAGITILAREIQPLKAPYPISVTVGGIINEVSAVQSLNAYEGIVVTPSGSMTFFKVLLYLASSP